jgi:ribonuclease HI
MRGRTGEWCGGVARGLGDCEVVVAELWGILEGLNHAWRLGFRRVELRCESQIVVHMLNKEENIHPARWSMCTRIKRLLRLNWEVRICHTYREANMCADALAHIGCELGNTLMFYESCPTQIRYLVAADAVGMSTPILVSF